MHTTINPWSTGATYGVSEAIEVTPVSRMLFIGGQVASDADGQTLCIGDMAGQLTVVLDKVERLLAVAGYTPSNLVQLNFYVPCPEEYFANMSIYLERTAKWAVKPTGVFCAPTVLGDPEWMIELTGMAVA